VNHKEEKPIVLERDGKIASLLGHRALHKLKKTLEVAGDVADAVIRLRDRPRAVDFIAVGLKFVQSLSGLASSNLYQYFERHGWKDLEDWGFAEDIISVCSAVNVEEVAGHEEYTLFQSVIPGVNGEDVVVGWAQEHEYKIGPYIKEDKFDESFKAIGRALWEHIGSNAIELTAASFKGSKAEGSVHDSACYLREDASRKEEVFESAMAYDILERIKKFNDKGHNRAIMLLGEPGTGKTSIMKFIANKLNLFTLRVNSGELNTINPRDIVRAVELLQPNLLMIDDFDRFEHAHSMLTELEQVSKSVKIFMVTCNSTENLDDAVLRPGRFDEIVNVDEIDPNIVEKMLGDVPKELAEILKSWPVAYIAEFHKRREVLGAEEAMKELGEFQSRLNIVLGKKEVVVVDEGSGGHRIPRIKMRPDGSLVLPNQLKRELESRLRKETKK
jgi:nucleoside-triphosphatase THEP1